MGNGYFQYERLINLDNGDLERMKSSYGYLFEIESKTRKQANVLLENLYGANSSIILSSQYKNKLSNKSLENMYFHELVSFLKMVPVLKESFGESYIKDLMQLIPIRNKIAHCNFINDKEFALLSRTYYLYENKFK
ncbi:hypothetical protein [Bacillus sp. es.036]|uniref:hypothetical protein n=1 Tax=Bacillus sp. es.036 TaxID=1761764 RepID=UPI000BF7ECBD|nr:hypothetical protein [Bacillus sp. es.036]